MGRAHILGIRWLAALTVAFTCACSGEDAPGPEAPSAPPHIVVLLADDLGWRDVGYHGSEIRTPHIDRLAREGVRLDQFYATPLCSATRAALLTGRHPHRYGLQSGFLRVGTSQGLPVEETTLAERLRDAGYATAIVGKWHLGVDRRAYLPLQRGFDHHYGGYGGTIDYFEHSVRGGLDWHRDERPVREQGYVTTLQGDEAVRLIEAHDPAVPLFLYVAFNAPHRPLQVPEHELEAYAEIGHAPRRTYAAMVSVMDRQIGRIVDAIDARGMERDTLILFASDNGGAPVSGGSNAPLRGRKGLVYEGGIRVPALARWPGRLEAGGVVHEPLHVVDLYPTLLTLAGGASEPRPRLDGVDVWPTLARGARAPREELLLYASPAASALREERWKLVLAKTGADAPETVELFDLASDPNERTDLGNEQPERRDRMRARLEALRAESVPLLSSPKQEIGGRSVPEVWGPLD